MKNTPVLKIAVWTALLMGPALLHAQQSTAAPQASSWVTVGSFTLLKQTSLYSQVPYTIYTPKESGFYRISVNLEIVGTTVKPDSFEVLCATMWYTDDSGRSVPRGAGFCASVQVSLTGDPAFFPASDVFVFHGKPKPITIYVVDQTFSVLSSTYNIIGTIERLSN